MYERYIKRCLDVICAILAIIVFWWLFVIVALLVYCNLGSPVFFSQVRPGKKESNGEEKLFRLYKFRTMTNERDEHGNLLSDDVRLTKFGRFLRKSSLDELPETINILKGDMSVIGPRPQLVRDVVFMTDNQRRRHNIRPGLSGLAQTRGRNALAWNEKLMVDIEYVKDVSFWNDVKILFDTVKQVVFRKKGLQDSNVDEIDIVEDYGDYLLAHNMISHEEYEIKQKLAIMKLETFYTSETNRYNKT